MYIHAGALTIQICKPINRKSHVCTLMGHLDVICVCLKGSELRDPGSLGDACVSVCVFEQKSMSLFYVRMSRED